MLRARQAPSLTGASPAQEQSPPYQLRNRRQEFAAHRQGLKVEALGLVGGGLDLRAQVYPFIDH